MGSECGGRMGTGTRHVAVLRPLLQKPQKGTLQSPHTAGQPVLPPESASCVTGCLNPLKKKNKKSKMKGRKQKGSREEKDEKVAPLTAASLPHVIQGL